MELLASILGVLSVYTAIFKKSETWILGILSSISLLFVLKSPGIITLQLVYIVIGVIGWLKWENRLSKTFVLYLFCFVGLIVSAKMGTNIFDILSLVLGVLATYFLINKHWVAWPIYIGSNIASIVVCYEQGLNIVLAQYVVFIVLSSIGFVKWLD